MANFHFIEDPTALSIIQTILDLAGPNYNAPYDSDSQPNNANERNNETLIQYQLPGGSELKGYAEPASSQNMGSAINSMLAALAPFISAYGLILPILGVIRGLIEIMCAMMNPFAVIAAVIRLFVKWIPPFISLFPPFAGIVIILSTIKAILAIVFFILTEVVPTVQLIINNIRAMVDAFGPNGNEQQIAASVEKLERVLEDLANRFGLLGILLPLLELILLLLGLVTGFPCSGGKRSDCSRGSLPRGADENFPCDESDTTNECPGVLKDPPEGRALLLPSFFGDSIPFFAYTVITLTGNSRLPEIRPYLQDFKSQLDPQLDEPVDEASPFGGDGNSAHFDLEITDRRGNTISSPIAGIRGNIIITINPILITKIGLVDYKIVPNYPMLIGRNIIGVGCHPDVETVIFQLQSRLGDTELSALDKNPEARNLLGDVQDLNEDLNGSLDRLRAITEEIADATPDPVVGFEPFVDRAQDEQDFLVDRLFNFQSDLKNTMNAIISRSTDRVASELEVDKNIVKAGGGDNIATVIVTPRDFTGSAIARNIPDDVDVAVEIFTNFGTLANQQRNNSTGQITAELSSPFPGVATISAKVNQDFITTFDGNNEVVKELEVQFVADSILPKRRKISRVGQTTKAATGSGSDREPGGR